MKDLKQKVLDWLKENKVDITGKRVRVYNYRGIPEVRIYNEPVDFLNSKKSRRFFKEPDEYGNNCTYGIHSRKISTYTHISESDLQNEDEKKFILEQFK